MESRFLENSEGQLTLNSTVHTSDLESAGNSGGFLLPSFVTRLETHDNQELTFEYDPSATVPINSLLRGDTGLDGIHHENLSGANKLILSEGRLDGGTQYTLVEQGTASYILTTPMNSGSFVVEGEDLLEVINQARLGTSNSESAEFIISRFETSHEDVQNVGTTALSGTTAGSAGRSKRKEEEITKPIGKGPYSCPVCKLEFSLWMSLKRHRRTHQDDRKLRCDICSATYNLQKNLVLHVAAHQTENLICPECGRKFGRYASFRSHLAIHQEEDNLTCPECEQEFSNELRLNDHLEINHSSSSTLPTTTTATGLKQSRNVTFKEMSSQVNPKLFACKKCQESFPAMTDLRDHMAKHLLFKNLVKSKHKKRRKSGKKNFSNKCKFCDKTFKKPSQCARHERIHTGDRPFKCTMCPRDFNQKNSLDIHQRKHTGFKPHICQFCKLGFTQSGNLRVHIMRVHNLSMSEAEAKFECEECSCSFRKLGSLNAHVSKFHIPVQTGLEIDQQQYQVKDLLSQALHSTGLTKDPTRDDLTTAEELKGHVVLADRDRDGKIRKHLVKIRLSNNIRLHLCNFCEKEFKKPSDLCRHLRVHTLEKPFKCKLCSRAFSVKSALKAHWRIHSTPRVHACTVCGKRFATAPILQAHKKLHEETPLTTETSTRDETFPCDQCSKLCVSAVHLKAHRDYHRRQKLQKQAGSSSKGPTDTTAPLVEPYIITQQGLVQGPPRHKSVYQPTRLELVERPHRCVSCTASFKKSSHLKQHERRHTGEKPFTCKKCNKSFVSRGTLNSHSKIHDQEEIYQCNQCTATFTTTSSVRRHIASHSEDKNFMCPYCQKTFKTSVLCKKHMKVHKSEAQAGKQPIAPSQIFTNQACQPMDVQPMQSIQPTYFTADSSGIITIPLQQASNLVALQDTNPTELIADIGTDGTITIKQNDFGVDLIEIGSSPGATFQLPTIIQMGPNRSTTSVLTEKQFNLMFQEQEPVTQLHLPQEPVNLPQEPVNLVNLPQLANMPPESVNLPQVNSCLSNMKETTQKSAAKDARIEIKSNQHSEDTMSRIFSCSWDNCESRFDSVDLLGQHLAAAHPPNRAESSRTRKRVERGKSLLIPSTLKIESAIDNESAEASNTLSEKVLLKSLAEKDRISELKAGEESVRTKMKFANQCNMCSMSFKKPSDLTRHIRTHTGEKPFACEKCNKRFTVKSTLETHKRVHNGPTEVIKCHVCQVQLASATALKTHMRLHTGAKPFLCPHCEQRFRTSGQRKTHMASQHAVQEDATAVAIQSGLIPLTIPAASMTQALDAVSNAGEPLLGATVRLQLHGSGLENAIAQLQVDENLLQQLRSGENIHIILNPMEMQDHDIFARLNDPPPPPPPQQTTETSLRLPSEQSSCTAKNPDEESDKNELASSRKMSRPKLKETTSLPVAGDELGQILNDGSVTEQTPNEANQTDQMDMSEIRYWNQVFICPWCDRVLSSESERLSHLLDVHGVKVEDIDVGGTPGDHEEDEEDEDLEVDKLMEGECGNELMDRTCQQCNKIFVKPSQLGRHMRIHTGERPFACVLCLKSFNQKNSLQIHMKKHTGERPFVCPFCSYAFTQKGNLKTHIQRSHAEQAQQLLERTLLNEQQNSAESSKQVS